MQSLLLNWLINALAFVITAYLLPGIRLSGFVPALIAAVVLGIVNALVWPLLTFLTFPITIITLGLFLFVVNGLCLKLVAALTPGLEIKGFMWAIIGSIVLSLVSGALSWLTQMPQSIPPA